jgi:hypothetical protein
MKTQRRKQVSKENIKCRLKSDSQALVQIVDMKNPAQVLKWRLSPHTTTRRESCEHPSNEPFNSFTALHPASRL